MSFKNGRDTLLLAINSILWQSYQNWELILINDGSTDGSEDLIQDLTEQRIRYYADQRNRGLAARLNQGVHLARGEYIARMDADDIAFPERLARQVAYLESHREVDLLASSVLMVDGNNNPIGIMRAGDNHQQITRRPWHGFPMPHPTWMGRSEWFRTHPYDEAAKKGQDQALLYQSYRQCRFAGLHEVLLGYRYERLSLRKTLLGRYHYLKTVAADRNFDLFCRGLLSHISAATRDIVFMLIGLDNRVIKTRVQVAEQAVLSQWQAILSQLPHSIAMNIDH